MRFQTLLFAVVLSGLAAAQNVPVAIDNFRLNDHGGRSWELYRAADSKAVVLCTVAGDAPESGAAKANVDALSQAFGTADAAFFVLDCAPEAVPTVVDDGKPLAPVLRDAAQDVTRELGATVIGEAVVVVPSKEWKVVYRGELASQPGREALEAALREIVAEKTPAAPATPPMGAPLPLAAAKTYDYAADVAPVIAAKCLACHSEGGVGPFAFRDHAQVKKYTRMMREVVRTAQMPPWHADPAYGSFHNSRALTTDERRAVLGWIAQGAPDSSEGRDLLAETAKPAHEAWQLGDPDVVLQIPNVEKIPAEGSVPYRYITVPTGLTEDKWVRAFEVRPGNRAVVHHALIFVIYPKEYRHLQPEADGGLDGFFAAYLPGMAQRPYPAEIGQFLPKGSAFIFQIHYNPTGKDETDQTQMGLYFQDVPPAKALNIIAASDTEFSIPANEADSPVRAGKKMHGDVELWGAMPHMHYRGGRAHFDLTTPGATPRTILNVPFYQFDWQPMYMFETPIPLPKESKIRVSGAFDNSKWNPKNPDPNSNVEFGEQSYEEMFIGYLAVAEPVEKEKYAARAVNPANYVGFGADLAADSLVGTRWRFEDGSDSVELGLHRFGIATVGGIPGSWGLDSGTVTVSVPFDSPFPLTLVGDELFWTGKPLRRLQ